MDRMNGAVVKHEARSDEISNSNAMMETEFVQKLKEIETKRGRPMEKWMALGGTTSVWGNKGWARC